jgi:hypothetical protein
MGQDSLDGRGIKVASLDHDGQRSYVYTQYIGILLTYNFNAARSKYKGEGAGNAEKNRF